MSKSVQQIAQDKEQKIMDTVAWYASYYRANPQRFVKDILGIDLHWFQSILIWAMMHYNFFLFIAARGKHIKKGLEDNNLPPPFFIDKK